jgi:tetratricopeptide (TPR) repeat protein
MSNRLRFIAKGAALLLLFCLVACGSSVERRDSFFEKAEEYFEEGRLDEARVEIKNALKIDEEFAPAYLLAAKIAERQKNWRKAFGNYSKAVEIDPGLIDAQIGMAKLYALGGELEKALEKATLVLNDAPQSIEAQIIKAVVLLRQKDDRGVTILEKIISDNPRREEAYVLMGDFYAETGDKAQAVRRYEQGLEANPDSKLLMYKLAGAYMGLENYGKAEDLYRRLYETDPENQSNRNLLIGYYVASRQHEKAMDLLDSFIAEEPDEQSYRLNKARILLSRGDPGEATEVLRKGIDAIDKAYDLRFALAEFLHSQKRFDEVETLLRETAEIDPEEPQAFEARKGLVKTYLAQGETEKAAKEVEEIGNRGTGDPEFHLLAGRLAMIEGEYRKATSELRQVVDLKPDNAAVYPLLAEAHFRNNEPLNGSQVLRKGVELHPESTEIRSALAQYLLRNRELDEALVQLRRIQELNPKDARAQILEGDILVMQQKYEQAEQVYRDLAELDTEGPIPQFKLGGLFAVREKYDKAHEYYDRALSRAPDAFRIMESKAEAYIAAEKPDQAGKFLAGQIEKHPDNPLLYELMGRVHLVSGDAAKAEEYFIRATELEPRWLLPYYRIGSLYLGRGEIDKGIRKFEQAQERNPESARLAFTLATLYQYNDNYEKARAKYESIIQKHPDFTPAMNNLAYLIAENSNDPAELEKALEMAEKAAQNEEPSTLDTLGWIHYKLGNLEKALESLDKAFRERPESPELGYHLATVLHAKGDSEGAKTVLEKIIESERAGEQLKKEIKRLYGEVSS